MRKGRNYERPARGEYFIPGANVYFTSKEVKKTTWSSTRRQLIQGVVNILDDQISQAERDIRSKH